MKPRTTQLFAYLVTGLLLFAASTSAALADRRHGGIVDYVGWILDNCGQNEERFCNNDVQFYLGLGLASNKIKGAASSSVKATTAGINLGAKINRHLAAEARFHFGIDDETIGNTTVKQKSAMGIYAKPMLPLGDNFRLYGLVGYTQVKISAGDSNSNGDLTYGAGLDFGITENTALGVEYLQLYDKEGADVSSLGANLNYYF